MSKIGPDGNFARGYPINLEDRGGAYASFSVLKERRLVVMNFGTVLNWVAVPPEIAKQQAEMIRTRIMEAFGKLSYDASTLPLKITANHEKIVVETHLPQTLEILAANPEMFLAWAEKLDAAADKLLSRKAN
jgi:hypothetical protein